MRNKKRRLIGSLVVLVAMVFAACIAGEPKTSTTEMALIFTTATGSGGVSSCGTVTVGSSANCQPVTISPDVGDDYLLTEIDSAGCSPNVWAKQLPGSPLPFPIACTGVGSNYEMFAGEFPVPDCVPVSYTFGATFSPTGPGSASCTMIAQLMNLNTGTTESHPIYFNGTGLAPPVGLSVSPASYDFGQIPIGTTSSMIPISVINTGAGSAFVTVTQSNPTLFPSNVANTSLAQGGSASFNVACSPATASTVTGSITFNGSGSGGSASRTIALSCTGINSNVSILPNPAAFASTLVGVPTPDVVVTITSTTMNSVTGVQLGSGADPELTIVSGAVSGAMIPIGMGVSHQVTLRYAPSQVHAQGPLGGLVVTTSSGSPRTVTITGEAFLGKLAAAPGTLDFGPVCVGSTATQTFEVYAEAPGSFNLVDVIDPASPFDVSSSQFSPPHQLRGNHANSVVFTASVTPMAANPELSGSLMLKSNLPANADMPLELRAVALPEGVSPTPSAVNFGPNPVKATTFAQKIVLSNCGSAPINISALRITGPSASEFAVVSPSNPLVMIPQKGEMEILVVMNPQTPGAKVAQLEIDHEGGTSIAMLDGNAFGGGLGDDDEMGTYYSCSVGGMAGFAPIGLALLVLRRRRRHR